MYIVTEMQVIFDPSLVLECFNYSLLFRVLYPPNQHIDSSRADIASVKSIADDVDCSVAWCDDA